MPDCGNTRRSSIVELDHITHIGNTCYRRVRAEELAS